MTHLVLATHNAHKLGEFRQIIAETIMGYDGPEPIEDGVSFEQNALIKARAAADHTGLPALADDSGICVDILGGSPGIFSARWAGPGKSDTDNVELLLAQLSDIADPHRSAKFVCTIGLVIPGQAGAAPVERTVRGEWPGTVALKPVGDNGFGYDPIFLPEGMDVTAAQLDAVQKNEYSHRSRAFRALKPLLAEYGI